MKWFLKILVLILGIIFFSHFCFAESFAEIKISENPNEKNTEVNIKWASLIEKYLIKYTTELNDFKKNNGIKNDIIIEKTTSEIQTIIFALRKIQTDKVEKEVAENVMNRAIARIKVINRDIKTYLKNKTMQIKQEAKEKQTKYSVFVEKIRIQMNAIIKRFKDNIKKERLPSKNDKKIYTHLLALEKESTKLANFETSSFENEKELKTSLLNILIHIKKEFSEIKKLLAQEK